MSSQPAIMTLIVLALALSQAEEQEQPARITSAARNGEIIGLVRDQASSQPLPAANIVVGSELGTASDVSGRFRIRGLLPGTYSVKASLIGYRTAIRTDVGVTAGRRRTELRHQRRSMRIFLQSTEKGPSI